MEVILLERIGRLGHMGDTVKVKDGYARNFLLPQGKALRANEANKKKFEAQRATLEARNNERKSSAKQSPRRLTARLSCLSAPRAKPANFMVLFRRVTLPI